MSEETNASNEDIREFLLESSAYLDEAEPFLVEARDSGIQSPEQLAALFRAFHSIKGVSGFLGFLTVQEVTHRAEEILDQVRTGKQSLDSALCSALIETCDLLRILLSSIADSGKDTGFDSDKDALIEKLNVCLAGGNLRDETVTGENLSAGFSNGLLFDELLSPDLLAKVLKSLNAWLEQGETILIGILEHPGQLDILENTARHIERFRFNVSVFGLKDAEALSLQFINCLRHASLGNEVFQTDAMTLFFSTFNCMKSLCVFPEPDEAVKASAQILKMELEKSISAAPPKPIGTMDAKDAKKDDGDKPSAPAKGAVSPQNEIRVSIEKLDRMVDLIEELGVVSGSLNFSSLDTGNAEDTLAQVSGKLRQVTEELQEVAMSVRLVPLSVVFRKMMRLVGDVSGKMGKKARLEIVGEQTEVDKDVVDSLQDPLVHILRNSVDHGLENPEERSAAGKPETGRVQLQAWHSGGEACISISDDGKGMVREKILAKAMERGLVQGGGEKLTDQEVFGFIFQPGFSMAAQVTEFSGRGVGMDVVKKNIDKLKGKIEIDSKPGLGTTILIKIPMSSALTESMLVRVGAIKYVIRIASIRETFRPERKNITVTPDGEEYIYLRDKLFRILRLHSLHRVANAITDLEEGLLIVVENRGNQLALFVDEVVAKIQGVIKPSPDFLKLAHTLAGYSIIGTQSDDVAWSLDIDNLQQVTPSATVTALK